MGGVGFRHVELLSFLFAISTRRTSFERYSDTDWRRLSTRTKFPREPAYVRRSKSSAGRRRPCITRYPFRGKKHFRAARNEAMRRAGAGNENNFNMFCFPRISRAKTLASRGGRSATQSAVMSLVTGEEPRKRTANMPEDEARIGFFGLWSRVGDEGLEAARSCISQARNRWALGPDAKGKRGRSNIDQPSMPSLAL